MKAKEKAKGFASLTTITACFGLKRDAYYKYKRREDKRLEIDLEALREQLWTHPDGTPKDDWLEDMHDKPGSI